MRHRAVLYGAVGTAHSAVLHQWRLRYAPHCLSPALGHAPLRPRRPPSFIIIIRTYAPRTARARDNVLHGGWALTPSYLAPSSVQLLAGYVMSTGETLSLCHPKG